MFNIFKKKVELKNLSSIAYSYYTKRGLKLGTEIIVPDNFECLIYHNEKHYFTLNSGKHKVDKETFSKLIHVQKDKKNKLKNIKCVCHYVNKSEQKIDFEIKKQTFTVEFTIEDSFKFLSLLLLYTYKLSDSYTQSYVVDVFKELLIHKSLNTSLITSADLSKFGINISKFSSNKPNKSTLFNTETKPVPLTDTTNSSNTTTLIEKSSNPTQNNSVKTEHHQSLSTCPKCNNVARFDTTYCLKCGYKLK